MIISEDDYMAILSRGIANDTFKSLVNSKSNTISDKSNDITTLSALYEGSIEYISESPIYPAKVTTDFLPDLATQALCRDHDDGRSYLGQYRDVHAWLEGPSVAPTLQEECVLATQSRPRSDGSLVPAL